MRTTPPRRPASARAKRPAAPLHPPLRKPNPRALDVLRQLEEVVTQLREGLSPEAKARTRWGSRSPTSWMWARWTEITKTGV